MCAAHRASDQSPSNLFFFSFFLGSVLEIERNHETRTNGDNPTFDAEVGLAQSASSMQTYYEWKLKSRENVTDQDKWNQVSAVKLATGRS